MDEKGYTKFDPKCVKVKDISEETIRELDNLRNKMVKLNLIGEYDNGIGFGNISKKSDNGFIISATKTGGIPKLGTQHYPEVTLYNFEENSVEYEGREEHPPSSEAMTHAAVYESDSSINAVIHIHNLEMWNSLLEKVPTTSKDAEYGTPEMAYEIRRLFRETNVGTKKILVMAGHEEGIVSFGRDLDEAGRVLLEYFNQSK